MVLALFGGLFAMDGAVMTPPTSPMIAYVGRWDRRDPMAPACQWTDTAFRVEVRGDNLTLRFDEKGHDFWEVRVNGRPVSVLELKDGVNDYPVSWKGNGGVSVVDVERRTEPFVGTTHFLGLSTDGKLEAGHPLKRHLEFVGDSITCGYGDEGKNQNEHFTPATENGTETYAAVAGRDLKADVEVLAWSGRKMWPDNTVPELYDRVLPADADSTYDFEGPAPDAVVINLATNDFGQVNPDKTGWVDGYVAFIRRVWTHYPKAHVYCVAGGMMSDNWPQGHHALSTLHDYLQAVEQDLHDPRVHLLDFDQQKDTDGIGADWHPNLVTHKRMAARLESALRRDLHWR